MSKVTVIMPSLNVAKYIKPCMDSVLHQTMQDMDILAIDAGSTDGTLEILKAYEKKDPRIKVIVSEKKSYGYQLNKGLALAKGAYIGIVETDDTIVPDMYEALYQIAADTEADYVRGVSEAFIENPIGDDFCYPMEIFSKEQYDSHQGAITVVPKEMPELVVLDNYLWNGIYRRTFVQDIRFNETEGAAYQDIGFMIQVHSKANKAVYMDKLVYRYRRDNTNASCYNKRAFRYLVQEYDYVNRRMEDKPEEWHLACLRKLLRQINNRFCTMAESGVFWEESIEDIQILAGTIRTAIHEGKLKEDDVTGKEWNTAMCLLENPRSLYDSSENPLHETLKAWADIVSKVENQHMVIFGCGAWGRFFHVLMECTKIGTVLAYCDNSPECKPFVQGMEVLKPKDAVFKYPDALYVIANKYHADEIKEQLRVLGILEEKMFIYQAGVDMLLLRQGGAI